MRKLALILLTFLAVIITGWSQASPTAQITFKVEDEDGFPVQGATIGMTTFVHWQPGEGFGKDVNDGPKGVSNGEGVVVLSYTSKTGEFGYRVQDMEGYYRDMGNSYRFTGQSSGRWTPWNPTVKIVFKKISNPVPMFARRVGIPPRSLDMPVLDEPVGFDLEMGNWMVPYGKGRVADFVFTANRRWTDKRDFAARMNLTFSNEGDGLQSVVASPQSDSELKLPKVAPENGYESSLSISISRAPGQTTQSSTKTGRSYIYRVRTVRDKNGKIISALYGKIHGDIQIGVMRSKTVSVSFVYYLNPDGTRNLEFDRTRNLFEGIKVTDRVNEP
ncbi:MAG TPA: hypothetical protein VIU12_14790 [Chryseolinea sp.]